MKITAVRTRLYEFDLARPISDANDSTGRSHVTNLAVFIDTDAGVTGMALTSPAARSHIHAMVNDLLLGRDPRGVKGLWKKMVDAVFKANNRGIVNAALSAIDVALWDLKARANNEPLWKTLGASTRKVKAYASGIEIGLPDEDMRAFYAGLAARGVCAGKLKVGLDIDTDLRRLQIMSDALAQSDHRPILMIDSNEYWSPKQAIRHISRIEQQFDLTWVEEPARRWDYRGLRQVSRSIKAAVATGENLDDISEFMPLMANEAVDVVEVGSGTSGITGAMQVADMAYGFELPVAMMNCPANFMAHLAAALPNHLMMEVAALGREVGMTFDCKIEDGWIVLGDAPGHGMNFDETRLAQMEVSAPSARGGAIGWGRRRGAGLYEVLPGEPQEVGEE
jgi:L-alanine-DL-glutamate epimerase-like enolase superfamily enzyme